MNYHNECAEYCCSMFQLEQVEALLPKLVPCVENKLAQMDSETVDSMFGFLDVYEKCMRGSLGETSTQREAEFKSCLEKNSDRPEHNIKLVYLISSHLNTTIHQLG